MGGETPLVSSVLMGAIPAKVAGVNEIIMVVPAPMGELNSLVLAAAAIAGVTRTFSIGGAQAVGKKISWPTSIFTPNPVLSMFSVNSIDVT